jgi:hypothetical protein
MKLIRNLAYLLLLSLAIISGDNDRMFAWIQSKIKSYEEVKIGNALVIKPQDWVVFYAKKNLDSGGLFYGYLPFQQINIPCGTFYVFKKIGLNKKVVICELDANSIERANRAIAFSSDSVNNGIIEIFSIHGFKAVKVVDTNKNGLAFSVPSIGVYITTNNLDIADILNFKIIKPNNE